LFVIDIRRNILGDF